MKLYNSISKQLENVVPRSLPTTVYSCGPTVYDRVHIGNLASFVFADTLKRVLSLEGHNVKHIMNLTDVDDKTIKKALSLHPDIDQNQALLATTQVYTDNFLEDLGKIGYDVDTTKFIKATDYIEQMLSLITKLYDAKIAYVADDGVYFSISAYIATGKKYGHMTDILLDSNTQSRINNDEYDKDNVADFALWKTKKNNEPFWKFELAGTTLDGRPGWHIECSAMAEAELGLPFDIHTGGIDLLFPHHENEIIQSTGASDASCYAKIFAHNEHIMVDGKKMSKSLGNFYTLFDIEAKGIEPLAFRLNVLQSHYRNQLNFSYDTALAAQNLLTNLRKTASLIDQIIIDPESNIGQDLVHNITNNFVSALYDDLNTGAALSNIAGLCTLIANQKYKVQDDQTIESLHLLFDTVNLAFGLNLQSTITIPGSLTKLSEQIVSAKNTKDYVLADSLKNSALELGYRIDDLGNSRHIIYQV
jgi:cysteinyl-tRNA synthetase